MAAHLLGECAAEQGPHIIKETNSPYPEMRAAGEERDKGRHSAEDWVTGHCLARADVYKAIKALMTRTPMLSRGKTKTG